VANGSAIDTSSPGSKSFTVTATDNVGNVETVTRNYTVVNPNTAPELTVPADKTVEATKAAGADVTYTVSAQDAQDGDLTSEVECSPASGNTFPLGTTTVNCSVTDSGGLSDSGSFTVTVVDTTPPNIANHDDITAEATGPGGAHVDYTEPDATDAVDGNVSVTCTPASGSLFSAGTTTVNCEATDAHNNKATGSFTVTVNYGWTVFFQPIDNNPDQSGDPTKATIWNSAKAGQAIPIKFNLSGNQGLSILATKNDLGVATAYPRSVKVTCPGATYPVDAIETYSSSTAAGLLYDPIADQYIYNWKTATSLANSCQMLDLKLADGTHHYAFFKFTK
jgi:hypothetical protein